MSSFYHFIESAKFEFERYKNLGDKTFLQVSDDALYWQPPEGGNSIAIIIKHMAGNMLSRWTNFLTEDGEKTWRDREDEFEAPPTTRKELLLIWEKGWSCLFKALDEIDDSNFGSKIKIRGEEHSIIQAVHRQLAHYSNHVGQIILLGKILKGAEWQSLSIPKGQSNNFNRDTFAKTS